MQFSLLAALLATITLLTVHVGAQSIAIDGYSDTRSCTGPAFGCTLASGQCCSAAPVGYGYSLSWSNIPAAAEGAGYARENCSGVRIAYAFGPGDRCWNGGGLRALSLDWFTSGAFERRAEGDEGSAVECVGPSRFSYPDADGVIRKIKVPAGNASAPDIIAALYEKKDFATLATFEPY